MFYSLIILTLAIFIISKLFSPLKIDGFGTAFAVAVVYSLINFFIGYFLAILTFPLILLSLGLFTFVINAFLLWFTNKMVDGFEISGIFNTILASVMISICTVVLRWLI